MIECNIYNTSKEYKLSSYKIKEKIDKIFHILKFENMELSIHFVGNKEIRMLNKKYRQIDKVTDVLTFYTKQAKEEKKDFFQPSDVLLDLGDIFVCLPQIEKQAKSNNLSFEEELWRMIIHGILHALGYMHNTEKQEKIMFFLQERVLFAIL